MKAKSKKLCTVLLSLIMVVTMMPQTAFKSEAAEHQKGEIVTADQIEKNSILRLPFKDTENYKDYKNVIDDCIDFRMLDKDQTNDGREDGVFVISDKTITVNVFLAEGRYKQFDDGKFYRGKEINDNWEYDKDADGNMILADTYQGSDLQSAMAKVYKDMSDVTKASVLSTSKTDDKYTIEKTGSAKLTYGKSCLSNEYVFPLSAQEAEECYEEAEDRKATGASDIWWLRSPCTWDENDYPGEITASGEHNANPCLPNIGVGVRVACNLTASSPFVSNGDGSYTLVDPLQYAKVEFIDDNGEKIKTDYVRKGSDIEAPRLESRVGYTATWDRPCTNITADTIIRAVYTPKKYQVTFRSGYGPEDVIDIQMVEYGKNAVAPNAPKRPGYIFDGWRENFTQIKASIDVLAEWRVSSAYKVKYETGFDKELPDKTDVVWRQKNLLKNIDRDCFTFDGWYVDGNFESQKVTDEMTYANLCNGNEKPTVTLYAKWTLNHQSKLVMKAATLTADGVKEHYECSVCKKWFSDEACTEEITNHGSLTIARPNKFTLSKSKYEYTGKAFRPTVTVKDKNGNDIAKENYTIQYKSNTNVGKATATVVFNKNTDYSGSKILDFTINPPKTSLGILKAGNKSFTASWTKKTKQVTGYEVQYSTSSKFASGNKTLVVKSYKTAKAAIKNLKSKKMYYVRIRTYKTIGKTKYYSSWSSAKSVKTK